MYINFQQNCHNRSVKTVHTNLFANNRKLHKFATTNSRFLKKLIISDKHHTCMSIFKKIGLLTDLVKTACTPIYLQNFMAI